MTNDNNYIAHKLTEWEKYLGNHSLPAWEQLPAIGLYMDQVVELLTQYLDFLIIDDKEDKVVTASAINNYVRMKIMPAPHKKKYSRVHIAYLIMICTLKQSLNIAYVQKMIPMDVSEQEFQELYSNYVERHKASSDYFIEELRTIAKRTLFTEDINHNTVRNLIYSSAVISGYSRLLTEELVKLQRNEDADDIGRVGEKR